MELTRAQILEGGYKYPRNLVQLIPTKHFLSRLIERGIGINCIPTLVRVTPENIHSGKTANGKTLYSVVVRLEYTYHRYIFLVFNPYDGALKTLWFKERFRNESRRRKTGSETSRQAVSNNRSEDVFLGYSRERGDICRKEEN